MILFILFTEFVYWIFYSFNPLCKMTLFKIITLIYTGSFQLKIDDILKQFNAVKITTMYEHIISY